MKANHFGVSLFVVPLHFIVFTTLFHAGHSVVAFQYVSKPVSFPPSNGTPVDLGLQIFGDYNDMCDGTQVDCRTDRLLVCDPYAKRCLCIVSTIYDSSQMGCVRQICSETLGCPPGNHYCDGGYCTSCWISGSYVCNSTSFRLPMWAVVTVIIVISLVSFGTFLSLYYCCYTCCCQEYIPSRPPFSALNFTSSSPPPTAVVYLIDNDAHQPVIIDQPIEWEEQSESLYAHPGQNLRFPKPTAPVMPEWESPPPYP